MQVFNTSELEAKPSYWLSGSLKITEHPLLVLLAESFITEDPAAASSFYRDILNVFVILKVMPADM